MGCISNIVLDNICIRTLRIVMIVKWVIIKNWFVQCSVVE